MQSSPVTVRTNSGFPLSLRSNRCSPAKVAMTDSGLLSPFASLTLRIQRPWAVYSRMPSSFGSAFRSEEGAGAGVEFAGASEGLRATSAWGGAGVGPGALDADRTPREAVASCALSAVKAALRFEGV